MNKIAIAVLLSAHLLIPNLSAADEVQTMPLDKDAPAKVAEIPTTEREFVDAINNFTKAQIIEQLGEPAKADDIKLKDSGRVVASIWHYHNINTAADGTYYQTTELDFIDDKVVQVVFLNNDGSERNDGGQAYELPAEKPAM